ncbi:MAG: radical SAM protein [Halobacteriales archaeon]|nr:radical SAM protein [Halobacteriales archaeon]
MDTSRRPVVLVWELTQACDLTCDHCRADAKPERHPDELTTREGKRLLEEVREFGEGQLVVLSGGDPLKRDDAVELVEHGDENGLRVTMTPSGTRSMTTENVRSLADAGLRRMALSIDGASAEAHDEFRCEEGSFDATLRAVEDVHDAGLPLQVNTSVCAETVEELPGIAELVEQLDAVLWSVFFLVPVGRGAFLDSVTPERAERVMEWLHEVSDECSFAVKTTEAPHYRRVVAQQGGTSRRAGVTAGDGFAFVSHTGDVYPSGFLPLSAGNVRDESVVDIYRNADLFESLRDPDELNGKCGACDYRALCGGSRSRAYATTGDPLGTDPLCAYVPDGYEQEVPSVNVSDEPG